MADVTPRIKEAIARVSAKRSIGRKVSGTGFLVTDRHLLTAFHVVGDRIATHEFGQPQLYADLTVSLSDPRVAPLPGRVVDGCFDAVDDWALVELEMPVVGIHPIPLGSISGYEVDQARQEGRPIRFESWGFPSLAANSESGIAIDGRIQDDEARYQDAWAYQLYSDNVAASLGDPLNGMSGAPCLVDGAAVGIIRSNLIASQSVSGGEGARVAGGILYACPFATASLQDCCAAYLPAIDPIRGLPGLPRGELPAEPFRHLRWYGAEHAEVLFGRNRRLRALYFQVTDPESPPVTLVYGASGVGKSSLLEAGLLPRLSWDYEIQVQEREAAKPPVAGFDDQLESTCRAARQSGKPTLVLLDQLEHVFTDPRFDGNIEVASLGARIKHVLTSDQRPPRIVLGFRSEWLANMRARLTEAGVPFGEFYLERLTRDEIEEVVRGVVSTRRLQKFYGVQVDKDLPRRVADDLSTDPESPVSPLLSIILTRLWAEAKTHEAGHQRLSGSVYDERMRNRLDLDQFLVEQIRNAAMVMPDEVASGLVTDVLYRHTTDQGTARELSWRELRELYHHLDQGSDHGSLRALVTALCANSLLYTVEAKGARDDSQPERQATRLAHDTLAPPVRKNYQKSDLPGQRAERRLATWTEDWQASEPQVGTIDARSLALIALGARGTRSPTERELAFIIASQAASELTSTRRRRARVLLGGLISLMLIGSISWWAEAWLKGQAYWLAHVYGRVLTAEQERVLGSAEVFKECAFCPQMVVVPAGTFLMGAPEISPDGEGRSGTPPAVGLRAPTQSVIRGLPQHAVTIARPFAVSKYEVTFDEWDACFEAGGCKTPGSAQSWGRGRRPVINVSWDDAKEYTAWLSKLTGKKYRLLSEAEWEYAARAGTKTAFSWGDDIGQALANCNGCGSDWDKEKSAPVGSFPPNAFGLHDMHGNVWEWVEDCNNETYRGAPSDGSAWLSGDCARRVIRGGAWITTPWALRLENRFRDDFNGRYFATGVRIARTLER